MNLIYPDGPASVPRDFARPGSTYQRKAWLAVGVLALFIALYLGLTGWFVTTAVWRFQALGSHSGPLEYIIFACSIFLSVFLIKALFFVKKGAVGNDAVEVKRADQPQLFAFLDRVADEARAPRPHKVFLSHRVNAAVFYDLSLLNLVFPSRKNLEIGLGLVNMLNLSEFKAVCAHEFGHFAQRSMAVGRWVYTTQQIASHIVAKRDMLDGWLNALSSFDVRLAWIGWILRLIVWSLRTVVDAGFRLVVIAQRALSREMEMQADLVAVSVAGSDAIVHALHRLQVADDAWERALNFARTEANAGRPPRDIFALQQAIAGRLSVVFNNPEYGNRPNVPEDARAAHRVFKAQMAQPPRMWATHPMNHEREQNAKRNYLFAPEDDRSAWDLFDGAQALREQATRTLAGDVEHEPVAVEDTLQRVDDVFTQERLKPAYRGLYVSLSPTRHARTVDALHERVDARPVDAESLYPPSLADDLARWQTLEQEYAQLCALRDGAFVAADGVIRHRGEIIQRGDLGTAIAEVKADSAKARAVLEAALKRVRSEHLSIASELSPAWHAHLLGALGVLHYANHAEADLRDAHRVVLHCLYRANARRSPRAEDIKAVNLAADATHRALERIFQDAGAVRPDSRVLAEFEAESWAAALGELKLDAPSASDLNHWLRYADSWVTHTCAALESLGRFTLNRLLADEAMLAAASRGAALAEVPEGVPTAPRGYDTLVIGGERELQNVESNLWDRLRNASGPLPGAGRAAVALCIVGGALMVGASVDSTQVVVFNDLAQRVVVTIDGKRVEVRPESKVTVAVNGGREVSVSATTERGEPLDAFQGLVRRQDRFVVYTVAAAAPLRTWTAAYGSAKGTAPTLLPPQRWRQVAADYVFTEPPSKLRATGSAVRNVVDAADEWAPLDRVNGLKDKDSAVAMVMAHVRYDAPDSHNLEDWLSLASSLPGFDATLAERLARFPEDVTGRRFEQELASGAAREAVCARHRALAAAAPANGDLAYLAIRCMPEGREKEKAFEAAHRQWPRSAWLANAIGWDAMEAGRYRDAEVALALAMQSNDTLRQSRAVDYLRLVRLRDPGNAMLQLEMRERTNPELRWLAMFEPRHSLPDEGVDRALGLLANGRLDEAVNLMNQMQGSPGAAYITRMAAASDGAPASLRASAKALAPDAGINSRSVWLALADGVSTDTPGVRDLLDAMSTQAGSTGGVAKVRAFVKLVRSGNVDGAERALDGPLHPVLRAQAYMAGVYVLGNRAPTAWRQFAQRALFAAERPYLAEQ